MLLRKMTSHESVKPGASGAGYLHFLQHLSSILWTHFRVVQLLHCEYLHRNDADQRYASPCPPASTYRLITDPFHLVNHAKATLPNTADDLVLVQLFDASIAVDAQPVGFTWFSRHLSGDVDVG